MHTSEDGRGGGGLPRKGDDPLGVPRNSTSWYRRAMFSLTQTNTHNQSLSPYITLSLLLRSRLSFFFFCSSVQPRSLSLSLSLFLRLLVLLSLSRMGGSWSAWADGYIEKKKEDLAKIRTACRNAEHSRCPFGISFPRRERAFRERDERIDTTVCPAIFISIRVGCTCARTVRIVKIRMQSTPIAFDVCALCLQNWLLNVIIYILHDGTLKILD